MSATQMKIYPGAILLRQDYTSSTTRLSLTSLVMKVGNKGFALIAKKDETLQCIEIRFVDEID